MMFWQHFVLAIVIEVPVLVILGGFCAKMAGRLGSAAYAAKEQYQEDWHIFWICFQTARNKP